jgi:hypothetical protein
MDMDFTKAKLSQEQKANAILIGNKAEELGIDPDLALAIAWRENQFRTQGKSPKGAIGLMQVMPGNAKAYGYKSEDLFDPIKNVEVGLKVFKENLDNFNGNERAALVGYNANPTVAKHYLNKGEDPSVIPDETKTYLEDIHSVRPLVADPTLAAEPSDFFEPVKDLPGHMKSKGKVGEEPLVHPGDLLIGGGLYGTSAGMLESMMNKPTKTPTSNVPPSDPRFGTTEFGTSGRAREVGFNLETQRRAEQAAANEDLLRRLRQGQIIGDESPVLKMGPMTATESGILVKPGALKSTPRTKTELVKEGIKEVPGKVGKFLSKYSKFAGPLGGVGAGLEAEEARKKFEEGDVIGGSLSGLSALSGATAITPGVPLPIRGAAGLASIPLGLGSAAWERAHPYKSVTENYPEGSLGELKKLKP